MICPYHFGVPALILATLPLLAGAQTVYLPEITNTVITTRAIDQSMSVGEIAGSADVTAIGGASYTIPIYVPPGTNDIQPTLALSYNSHGGDGLLGWGWGLSGLSAIYRVGRDWYHDGFSKGVSYTSSDRFAADGQRLVGLSGTYGASGSTYDTEAAAFSVFTATGVIGSGPSSFTAITKEGMRMEYGTTADSRVMGNNGNSVAMWRLSKVMDPFGNFMTYTYSSSDGESILTRIDYTGNSTVGITPYNKVEFTYGSRPDKNEVLMPGSGHKTSNLLNSITVYCEGVVMKTYQLNYSLRNINKSYLREVAEVGADGSFSFNTTILKYGDPVVQPFTVESSTALIGQAHEYYSGDFNGDGRTELMTSPYTYTADGFKYNTSIRIYRRTTPGNLQLDWQLTLDPNIQVVNKLNMPMNRASHASQDFSGDGRDDLTLAKVAKVGSYYRLQELAFMRSTGTSSISFSTTTLGPPTFTGAGGSPTYDIVHPSTLQFQVTGDFNGDGKSDALIAVSNGGSYLPFLYSPEADITGAFVSNSTVIANAITTASNLIVLDFDGDGAQEIMAIPGPLSSFQSARIYKMSSATNPPAFDLVYQNAGFPTPQHQILVGDFNGDGKTDLLTRHGTTSPWNIAYSTGSGFIERPFTQFSTYVNLGGTPDMLRVADFNGDGRSDILHGRNLTSSSILDVFYSRGSHADFELRTFSHSNLLGWGQSVVTDLDGRFEAINSASISQPIQLFFFDRNGHDRSLHKVASGLGSITEFVYGYMTEPNVHTAGASFTYPAGDAQFPLELVKELKSPTGLGTWTTTSFSYGLATVDRRGRGFLGFREMATMSPVNNSIHRQFMALQTDYSELYPTGTTLRRLDNSSLVNSSTVVLAYQAIGTVNLRRRLVRMVSNSTTDELAGTTSTTTNTAWNVCGLATSSTTNVNSIVTSSTTATYTAAGPSTSPVKPLSILTTTTRTGAPAQTVSTAFVYNSTSGALTKRTEFNNKPIKLITDYEYWPSGSLKKTTLSFTGLAANNHRVRSWTYESKYRFPATATTRWNNNGTLVDVVEGFTYDPKWGTVLTHLSTDQLQTDHLYDAFGRQTSVSAPYVPGTPRYSKTTQWVWNVAGSKRYYMEVTDPGGPNSKVWYDHLGREVERQTASFASGAWATSNMTYDAAGRVATTTLPRLSGETAQTITNSYDELGRPSSEVNSFSGTTAYSYSYSSGKLTTTVTDPASRSRSTTTDASGQVIEASDNGGTLTYAYDSWGNLLNVKRGAQTLITNTYDTYGRQTKMVDADAGATDYLYNAFNLLVWQRNAHGQVSTLAYDNIGRLVQRDDPEGTSYWTYYFVGGKFNNNVTSAIGLGTTYTYTYDTFGRRTHEVRTSPSGNMGKQYGYDAFDRLSTATYENQPQQVAITYTYTGTGHLDKVQQLNGPILFQGLTMNGFGRYRTYKLADDKTTTVTYAQQYPTRIQASGVQDLRMAYDYQTGNLTHRWDYLKNRKETFLYDGLDRLTQAKTDVVNALGTPTTNLATINYGFDGSVGGTTRGNLVTRTDIGTFGYNGNRISAAYGPLYPTPPDNPPLAINQATQTVTYASFHQPITVQESVASNPFTLTYTYGPDHQRTNSQLTAPGGGGYYETRQYFGELERQEFEGGDHNWILYVSGGDGLCAMIVLESHSGQTTYSVYKDHLGSIVALTKKVGSTVSVVAQQNFDAWGRKRNATNWTYTGIAAVPQWLYRGYTGHEHVEPFALINMNGRMYDPLNGRMLSADNYVQGMHDTQGFNRYTYALNNPLKYTDPSGEIVWAPIILGAVIGAYSGGVMSNSGNFNPSKWDFGSGTTWKYMLGGAVVGGLSGAAGYAMAASGLPGANTAAIAVGSYTNSFGMHLVSGGRSPVSLSVGAGSYNFSSGEFGYLGQSGNSTMETVGYSLGALANISDVLAGLNPSAVQLSTEQSDAIGHSALTNVGETNPYNSLVSVGPDPGGSWIFNPFKFRNGTNQWNNYVNAGDDVALVRIDGINLQRIMNYGTNLDRGVNYNLYFSSCVNHTARALTLSGAPSIGIHPFILHSQMVLRSIGFRPMLHSYHLYQH
ncbi:MAG: VCBS repeat-containing protein [Flavobacteriales bacterium]|nr:VCBS repeat-containing protein [Flavobacteriales bacterium]